MNRERPRDPLPGCTAIVCSSLGVLGRAVGREVGAGRPWPEGGGSGRRLVSAPGVGAPLTAPAFAGLLRVPGDRRRRDRRPAVRLPRLLQPVHLILFSEQERAFLRLRLVQRV